MRRSSLTPILSLMLFLSSPLAVCAEQRRLEAYACEQDGVTSFSDAPCGPSAQRIGVDFDQPRPATVDAAREQAAEAAAQSDLIQQQIRLRREIARSEGRLSDLRKERDAKLEQLRSTLNASGGRVTYSIWNSSVREQMDEVAVRYDSDIEAEQAKLEALQQRAAAIGRP